MLVVLVQAVTVYWPETHTVQVLQVARSADVVYVDPNEQSVQTASAVEEHADATDFPATQEVHGNDVLVLQNEFTGQATGAAAAPAHVKPGGHAT